MITEARHKGILDISNKEQLKEFKRIIRIKAKDDIETPPNSDNEEWRDLANQKQQIGLKNG